MTTQRTGAHPVILGSAPRRTRANVLSAQREEGRANPILDWARDLHDGGDPYAWGMDLLELTQSLRMAYDSPRIGGGIDPELATNVPDIESLRFEGGMASYVLGDPTDPDDTSALEGLTPDQIQDTITHAEAVAVRYLALCRAHRKDY